MKLDKAAFERNWLKPSTIALGLIVGLSLTVGACTADAPETTAETSANAPVAGDASEVEQNNDEDTDLMDQIGESFYFHGKFQNQFSDALFVVAEDEDRDWGNVLVLNQSDRSFQVPDDAATPLWIYGTVEILSEADLESNGVPESEWEKYEGNPLIVAERITLVPDPDTLVNNADTFINQPVTVYGKVEPVPVADTFILEDPGLFGGKGIILIQGADADLNAVIQSEKAVVSGVLRPYVIADLEEEYDLTWELSLQEQLEADFEQSPALIFDQALPVSN
ncbi:MAG: hypothetical protein ACFBSG_02155 [Leptolyngbyaceae cyanobacterium]